MSIHVLEDEIVDDVLEALASGAIGDEDLDDIVDAFLSVWPENLDDDEDLDLDYMVGAMILDDPGLIDAGRDVVMPTEAHRVALTKLEAACARTLAVYLVDSDRGTAIGGPTWTHAWMPLHGCDSERHAGFDAEGFAIIEMERELFRARRVEQSVGELDAGRKREGMFRDRDGGTTWRGCGVLWSWRDDLHPRHFHVEEQTVRTDHLGNLVAELTGLVDAALGVGLPIVWFEASGIIE